MSFCKEVIEVVEVVVEGRSGREDIKMSHSFLCCPVNHECQVKQSPDRKKTHHLLKLINETKNYTKSESHDVVNYIGLNL